MAHAESAVIDVQVIGGGIAALTVAHALRRAGVDVQFHERAENVRAEGGALLLWSNAMRALAELGLADAVVAAGRVLESTEFRTWTGETMWTLPVGAYGTRAGAPSVVIGRAALIEILAVEVRDRAHCGRRFIGARADDDHVNAYFEDGAAARGKVLLGADGLHSVVRDQLFGPELVRAVGQVAWVGISRGCSSHLPPSGAVAIASAGLRFWAAPLQGQDVYWYATLPDRATSLVRDLDRLAARFGDWAGAVSAIIAGTRAGDAVCTRVFDRPPRTSWGRGRVTLLGDAAHPSTPDLGQGACQAIESALALSRAIVSLGPCAAALRRYESARVPRTARVTRLSRATAIAGFAEGPAEVLRDLGTRHLLPRLAERELGWLLGFARGAHEYQSDTHDGDDTALVTHDQLARDPLLAVNDRPLAGRDPHVDRRAAPRPDLERGVRRERE